VVAGDYSNGLSLIDLRNGPSFLAAGFWLLAFSECRKNRFSQAPVARSQMQKTF